MLSLYFTECQFNKMHRTWQVYNTKVAFHSSGSSSKWFAEVSWSPFNGTYKIVYSCENKNIVSCAIKRMTKNSPVSFPLKFRCSVHKEPFTQGYVSQDRFFCDSHCLVCQTSPSLL